MQATKGIQEDKWGSIIFVGLFWLINCVCVCILFHLIKKLIHCFLFITLRGFLARPLCAVIHTDLVYISHYNDETNNQQQVTNFHLRYRNIKTHSKKKRKKKPNKQIWGGLPVKSNSEQRLLRGTLNQLCTVKSVESINGRKRKRKRKDWIKNV